MFESPRAAFGAGARTIAPILLGALPFGMVVGAVSAEVGLSFVQAVAMSAIVFAGTAQLVSLELLNDNVITVIIVFSAFMVNLRHMIYSASLSRHLKSLSSGWKLLLSYLLLDQIYALTIAHYDTYPDTRHKQWYHFGMAVPIWWTWMGATVVGFFVGAIIPSSWSLNFVIPLMFLALLVPAIKGFPYLAAAVVSTAVALLAVDLPNNMGFILAILSGIATGTILERVK